MTDDSRTVRGALLSDGAHYDRVINDTVRAAKVSVWVATANVKELRVEAPIGTRARARGRFVSILEVFADLARRDVDLRLLHAGVPSRPFMAEYKKNARALSRRFEMRRCPRVHLKMIAVDGRRLYLGSANFTGAGLGAKGAGRRNFEMGFLTDDDVFLDVAQARFERIWSGKECAGCALRHACDRPLDMAREAKPKPNELPKVRPLPHSTQR